MPDFTTELEAIDRLHKHVHESEVLVAGVRSAPGFDSKRIADAISVGTWSSRGHNVSQYEVKCTRSDWLSELKNPDKMEVFAPYMNYIWLVVANKNIVHDGELPDGWGLLASNGDGLRKIVQAKKRKAKPLPVGLLVTMLRAERRVTEDAMGRTPSAAALYGEYKRGCIEGKKQSDNRHEIETTRVHADCDRMKRAIAAFEESSGLRIVDRYTPARAAANLGKCVRVIQTGGIERLQQHVPEIELAIKSLNDGVAAIKSLCSNGDA